MARKHKLQVTPMARKHKLCARKIMIISVNEEFTTEMAHVRHHEFQEGNFE